jgi:hypothetical protein
VELQFPARALPERKTEYLRNTLAQLWIAEDGSSKNSPFSREGAVRNRLTSPPVPIGCVGQITLFAVQVGMNPSALAVLLIDLS